MISQLLNLPMWQNVAGLAKLAAQREVLMHAGSAARADFVASACDVGSCDVGMLPMIEIMGWRLHCPVGTKSLH